MPKNAALEVVSACQIKTPPFLKWVGGKARLRSALQYRLPPDYRQLRHIEPFVGGGALFFSMAPNDAVLADSNPDLINAYHQVALRPGKVIAELTWLKREHCKDAYYEVRELFNSERHNPESELELPRFNQAEPSGTALRAAVFIYLNKTCFNGLYRENKDGEFNVPMGDYEDPGIFEESVIYRCSELLARRPADTFWCSPGVRLGCTDFRHICGRASDGDFVYLDPPYDPLKDGAGNFTGYNASGFGEDDQHALAIYCDGMTERGVRWLQSNHDTPLIRELYKGCIIEGLMAPRSVGAKHREDAAEVLIRNYEEVSRGIGL